jgi:hypothetical protein
MGLCASVASAPEITTRDSGDSGERKASSVAIS